MRCLWALSRRAALMAVVLAVLVFPVLAAGPAVAFEGRLVHLDTGAPVAGAEVSVLGRTGVVRTDADGRFTWTPDPAPPFELLVVLPGGHYMKPVFITHLPAKGVLTIEVSPLVSEIVTVAAGAAPRIETTPGSGMTLLSAHDLEVRQPANLTQALENVAGVSTVSEGHAAVPAVRGLARGRTLILIDGARVTSERRVGPSATFLDPFVLEGIDVARGPGSVAYGSDAFGGIIHARTRRVDPSAPLGFRFAGAFGAGIPEARGAVEVSKGLGNGGLLVQAHTRRFDDYRSPGGEVFNSGAEDHGVLARLDYTVGRGVMSAGWQSDFGRNVERPRNNSRVTRFFYPTEDSHRFTASYDLYQVKGFSKIGVSGFLGSYVQVTDQDRYATSSAPRQIERADVAAKDFAIRGMAERLAGSTKLEIGVDVNGRYGLEALDSKIEFDAAGSLTATTTNVSVDRAGRTDLGVYAMAEHALVPTLMVAGGIRGDRVKTENVGGYFGDRSTSNGAASGFLSLTAGSFHGFSVTGQVARGFRDPMLSDRYYRGPTGRGYITGNPDLTPESSLQFDLALRYAASRHRWALYAYQYRINDLVERYETSRDFFYFRNRGRVRLRGVEVEAQLELGAGLSLELAGQVSRGVALDDGAALDDVPSESLSVQVRKRFGERTFVQVRGAAFAFDDLPGPTERVMPGYTMVDLSAGYTVNRHLDIKFLGRNLLDRAYLASPDTRAVQAPGVSGLVSMVVSY